MSGDCNNKQRGYNLNDVTNHFNMNTEMNAKYNFRTDENGYLLLIQNRIM